MLPNTGISSTVVANALSSGSNRKWPYLCTHPNINKWSKKKPVQYNSSLPLTDNLFKSTNYGLTPQGFTKSEAVVNSVKSWLYNKPTGPYRIGDFRSYNHDSLCPMKFEFGNGSTNYVYNTYSLSALPYVRVYYRLNESVCSPGMTGADLPLLDINTSGVTTENIDKYVACLTSGKDGDLYVANAKDTLGLKFGTNIADYVVTLDDFTMGDAFVADTTSYTYPQGATNKEILLLHPKINKIIPSSYGAVFNNNGSPSTTSGNNGWYTTATSPFLAAPDSSPLILRRYRIIPLSIAYQYLSVMNSSSYVINNWGATLIQGGTGTGVTTLGGKVLYYNTQSVTVQVFLTVKNVTTSEAVIRPKSFYSGSLFPKSGEITLRVGSFTSEVLSLLTIAPNATMPLYLTIKYQAGVRTNYTIPTLVSPSYGVDRITITFLVFTSSGEWSEELIPNQNDGAKEFRWR